MNKATIISISLGAVVVLLVAYLVYTKQISDKQLSEALSSITSMENKLAAMEQDKKTTEDLLSAKDLELETKTDQLNKLRDDIQDLEEELEDEESRLNPIKSALSRVADDVATQRKLESIDPELLQKYSNVYFLNENYIPSSLSAIPDEFSTKPEKFHSKALPFLEELLADAKSDGINIKVTSAYRSFERQTELKAYYTTVYGSGANTFSADQGYSEHQLGTTVDFVSSENGNSLEGFGNTTAYEWLQDNAHKYGFVLSYPDGNQYYQFEPWHWRFVGTDLADDLHDNDQYLYDMDERELQEYRLELFD